MTDPKQGETVAEMIEDMGRAWDDRYHPAGHVMSGFEWRKAAEYIAERLADEGVLR